MDVTLLGPQRRVAGARSAVAELVPDGPVAAVNAGWLEREADTGELDDVLGGRLVNLELHQRWQTLREDDPDFDASQLRLSNALTELRTAYRLRLSQALAAVAAVRRQVRDEGLREAADADGVEAIRALDAWNLRCGQQIRGDAAAEVRASNSDALARHREDVGRLLGDSAGLVVTGGHVAILLHLLQLFGIADQLRDSTIGFPVIAWSAGAMALAERVVLFHDHPPYGARPAEVYAVGIAAYTGVVPLPHARRRLRLDDHDHVGLMARRLAPGRGVVMNDGARLDLRDGQSLPDWAPRLSETGRVVTGADAAPASGRASRAW